MKKVISRRRQERLSKLRKTVFSVMLIEVMKITATLKPTRRWWVRPWLIPKKGNLNLVHHEFKQDAEQFQCFLRMNSNTFTKCLTLIENAISKEDTFLRSAIPAKAKLVVTLRFLATGETYRSLMYTFRIAESTISLLVPKVCRCIYDTLKETYLKVPNTAAEWLNIAQVFENTWNFPNTVGGLDGKHIIFSAPRSSGSMYFNYKHQHSIVLLAVVDANYNFLYVDVGSDGRISDGGVFRRSSFCSAISRNTINLPEDKPLPGRQDAVPFVFVADAAFAEHILKPFPFRNMDERQQNFNHRLSRGRRVVENAFGILANRFRILLSPINLSVEKVQDVSYAVVYFTTS